LFSDSDITEQKQSLNLVRSVSSNSDEHEERGKSNHENTGFQQNRAIRDKDGRNVRRNEMLRETSISGTIELSPELIKQEQIKDSVLQPIIQALGRGVNLLHENTEHLDSETQCIVSQWDSLISLNGILYRTFQNGDGDYSLLSIDSTVKTAVRSTEATTCWPHFWSFV
jgi:hypothetical protein